MAFEKKDKNDYPDILTDLRTSANKESVSILESLEASILIDRCTSALRDKKFPVQVQCTTEHRNEWRTWNVNMQDRAIETAKTKLEQAGYTVDTRTFDVKEYTQHNMADGECPSTVRTYLFITKPSKTKAVL
jgi:hypothetical protein